MVTDEIMKHEQRAKIKLLEKEREKNEESDKKTRSNRSKGKRNQLQERSTARTHLFNYIKTIVFVIVLVSVT